MKNVLRNLIYIYKSLNNYLFLIKAVKIRKMNKQPKNKLKTLPNQLTTNHQQFLFQSQDQQGVKIRKINLASPTFATTQIGSGDENILSSSLVTDKQNKIGLGLKDLSLNNNNLRTVNQPRIFFQSTKKSDFDFLKGQNQKLVQKCKILDQMKKKMEQENQILVTKLNICKSCLQQKKFKNMQKFLHMQNSSNQLSNIDLYLQMQAFKQDYKQCKDKNLYLQNQNNVLNLKIIQLQQIIKNYTQKSEKKKTNQEQKQDNDKQKEKKNQKKIEQLQKKYQERQREMINQCKQKDKIIKKLKDEYEKLKFLKEQIQKKRQEDIKNKQFLQNQLEQKEENLLKLRQEIINIKQECQHKQNKLQQSTKMLYDLENQVQILKTLTFNLQKEKKELMNNLKIIKDEIEKFEKQKKLLLENFDQLNKQKKNLQVAVADHILKQQMQEKRISELQCKFNETQNQLQKVRVQFEKSLQNKESFIQINKFKLQQNSQQIFYKDNENEKKKEEKFHIIIEELNIEIQELRKQKQNLQASLYTEREKYQKIYNELENTYRKYQQCSNFELQKQQFQYIKQFKQKDRHNKKLDIFGLTLNGPSEFSRSTKAFPQLKMIRQILAAMLIKDGVQGINYPIKSLIRGQKQKQLTSIIQFLIDDIKKMVEQVADIFDESRNQIQNLQRKIQNKQQVISKLLRFTPEPKKGCILQYLKVMENINQYQIQHVYKVTKNLQQEANNWRKNILKLYKTIDENQQEIVSLRIQIQKMKNQDGMRKFQNNYNQKIENKKQKKQLQQKYFRKNLEKYEKFDLRKC